MASILELFRDCPERSFTPGQIILQQGESTGRLYFLISGTVEVVKDEVRLASVSQSGAVFGEMAMLLHGPHTATVRAVQPCSFYVLENPREFLSKSPAACLHVSDLLAHRIDALNRYLVDVKHQFEGHDHLGMVDGILDTLLHRPARHVIRPKESTIHAAESLD